MKACFICSNDVHITSCAIYKYAASEDQLRLLLLLIMESFCCVNWRLFNSPYRLTYITFYVSYENLVIDIYLSIYLSIYIYQQVLYIYIYIYI